MSISDISKKPITVRENSTISDLRNGFFSEEGFRNISLARDVMTEGLIIIKFNQSLSDECKLILENNVMV